MLSQAAITALFGVVAVYAAPAPIVSTISVAASACSAPSPTGAACPASAQTPFKFPLPNGFPNLSNTSLAQVEQQAHGTVPNSALPTTIADVTKTIFELIAFNELFEVAFFTSLINNITNNVCGFEISDPDTKTNILDNLLRIQAVEELHALGANAILTTSGNTAIEPCEYVFPSTDLTSAIRLASTFTDVVLGTLSDALGAFAADGDGALSPLIGSVIGDEAEQDGWFRQTLNITATQLPFLTESTGKWAFSVLNQLFVVAGTCPNKDLIDIPVFDALTVVTPNIQAQDQTLQFSFVNNGTDTSDIYLVYVNQQNVPVVVKPSAVSEADGVVTFSADFPFSANLMYGLTLASVTTSAGPFDSADAVAAAAVYGPGIIEIE